MSFKQENVPLQQTVQLHDRSHAFFSMKNRKNIKWNTATVSLLAGKSETTYGRQMKPILLTLTL